MCRYAGNGQGELSLLRQLWDVLRPEMLTDRLMANWLNILLLQQRGIELVARLNKANRRADFRRGKRLDRHDHIVRWYKPTSIRSLNWQACKVLPEFITVRETLIPVAQPGFPQDLADLYRARWNNELDPRSIKCTLQMHELLCKELYPKVVDELS